MICRASIAGVVTVAVTVALTVALMGALTGGCGAPEAPRPEAPASSPPGAVLPPTGAPDAGVGPVLDAAGSVVDPAVAVTDAGVEAAPDATSVAAIPERWLKGSTHVHARPSGDSRAPIASVIQWYETRGYDFIVLTDHNKISEVGTGTSTVGSPAVLAPERGLIVIAGVELTHNPDGCQPAGEPRGRCRIHVNLLGTLARPVGKIPWADRKTNQRIGKYQAALTHRARLGGLAQINHPSWFWGMTGELLVELARRGFELVEIANVQFPTWNAGDASHPSIEALWDHALGRGVTLWGVATDDAHDYRGREGAEYPAGGGWVVVKARPDPASILASLAAGRFYSSTGVVLARAEVDGGELVVEVAADQRGPHTITFIENGGPVATIRARTARRPLPATGYVRAVVTGRGGAQAWVQPARR